MFQDKTEPFALLWAGKKKITHAMWEGELWFISDVPSYLKESRHSEYAKKPVRVFGVLKFLLSRARRGVLRVFLEFLRLPPAF